MRPLFLGYTARAVLLSASIATLLASCSPDPSSPDSAPGNAADSPRPNPPVDAIWARWKAYGDEIGYIDTRYSVEGSPIVAETLDIWRPEPGLTYRIRDRRAFWCNEEEVALLQRWTSANAAPFQEREISEDRRRRKSIRDFDVHSNTSGAPPNQIANLHRKICNRQFGDRVADPMEDFERILRDR